MKYYFAYGSCLNGPSFAETMKEGGEEGSYMKKGIARLDNYRLAFSKYAASREGGVLDVVTSPGDFVLGVLYEIDDLAEKKLDLREGAPRFYRQQALEVMFGDFPVKCFTYEVVNKRREEVCPSGE
ncbi:MAG: gamma-glutamylcyclotransferase family protein [Candidatus Eremiobacteraeota bacterium]|nr:gamma-glutamylcyclotransferase family protein [Candidatus Eremiobacteraeota bacterium]